jgi:hypothetical protein
MGLSTITLLRFTRYLRLEQSEAPFGLISDPQSLISFINHLRVPPFTSASLALTRWFTLTDVTTGSQAPGFTITTASSAGPRPITDHVSAWLRA